MKLLTGGRDDAVDQPVLDGLLRREVAAGKGSGDFRGAAGILSSVFQPVRGLPRMLADAASPVAPNVLADDLLVAASEHGDKFNISLRCRGGEGGPACSDSGLCAKQCLHNRAPLRSSGEAASTPSRYCPAPLHLRCVLQLIGADHDIGYGAKGAVGARRAGHDARVRQRVAEALLAAGQDHGGVAKGLLRETCRRRIGQGASARRAGAVAPCHPGAPALPWQAGGAHLPNDERVNVGADVGHRVHDGCGLRLKAHRLAGRRLRACAAGSGGRGVGAGEPRLVPSPCPKAAALLAGGLWSCSWLRGAEPLAALRAQRQRCPSSCTHPSC